MRKVTLKEGPLVFLRNVFIMELLALFVFVGISYLENYEALFNAYGIIKYVRYDLFVMISFSAFQLVYIMTLFFDWYFTYFEIKDAEISRKSGLLWRKNKSVILSDVTTVESHQSPLGRLMKHANIIIEHGNGRTTKIKNVNNFEEYVHIINQNLRALGRNLPIHSAKDLIKSGESKTVEFKETFRFDLRKKEVSKEVEKSSLKSILGFMNADGGTLIIGVNDDGAIIGMDTDYNNLPKKNRDGFENHISMTIKTMIGLHFSKYISINFEEIDGKEICIVNVSPSHKPAYFIGADRKEEFFVRVGNSTQAFTMSEAEEYIKTRWR